MSVDELKTSFAPVSCESDAIKEPMSLLIDHGAYTTKPGEPLKDFIERNYPKHFCGF